MQTIDSDVKLIHCDKFYPDERGFFLESFNEDIQNIIGKDVTFVQDNHSKSWAYILRGLHYQWDKPMGKLLRVVSGSGIDVVVDIRKDSPTFGQHLMFKLTSPRDLLWVPPGYAQGFLALTDDTHLCYKTTAYHNPDGEGSINPLDPTLDIFWECDPREILLSDKDKNAQSFEQYRLNPRF